MMPVMADAALESVRLLARATAAFTSRLSAGMEANVERCRAEVEKSMAMATGLNPYIGYERAAALAKEALKSGKTMPRTGPGEEAAVRRCNWTRRSIPGG